MEKHNGPTCSKDGFPKVKIAGRWHCVAEYLDRCIGGQRIVDMVEREGTVYYVFENGHELPSLCFCCGTPYEYRDLEATRRENVGRHLESMIMEPGQTEDGQFVSRFCLELSGKGLLSQPLTEPIHIEAAAQMRHPANCSRGRAVTVIQHVVKTLGNRAGGFYTRELRARARAARRRTGFELVTLESIEME